MGAERRAVVVDDDESRREGFAELLSDAGWQVAQAVDGCDGLDQIRLLPPRLIITDIDMPRINGVLLARAIRQDASLCGAILVALTGLRLSPGDAGVFDAVLTKPVNPDLFLETVQALEDGRSLS